MPETWHTDYIHPNYAVLVTCQPWDHVFRSDVDLKCICGRTKRALR